MQKERAGNGVAVTKRRKGRVGRKLVATMPVLLVLGIVAQVVLLAAVIVLYVPCLIWPQILNGPYQWITKGMVRIMARSFIGRKREKTLAPSVTSDVADP